MRVHDEPTLKAVGRILAALAPLTHEQRLNAIALAVRLWIDERWEPGEPARAMLREALRRRR